ncbi:MAG: hypothetical protein AAB473_03485 [Patescibacteria group bacterium]
MDDEISPTRSPRRTPVPTPRLAFDSPFNDPTQRNSGSHSLFTVMDGGRSRAEGPPAIVVAETPAPEPATSVKLDPPVATVTNWSPRWWRMLVILTLQYGRWSIIGWPLYTIFCAWRSYDVKCALDALTLRYGRGDVGFDIGLKISEILKHGTSIEDLCVIENATRSSRFRPFGLEATFADETMNGASLLHHLNWACGLVRSPISPTINP